MSSNSFNAALVFSRIAWLARPRRLCAIFCSKHINLDALKVEAYLSPVVVKSGSLLFTRKSYSDLCVLVVMNRKIASSLLRLNESDETTTAGRTVVAVKSVNGKGTSTISPLFNM